MMRPVIIKWELLSQNLSENMEEYHLMVFVQHDKPLHFGILPVASKEQYIWNFIRQHNIVLNEVELYVGIIMEPPHDNLNNTDKRQLINQLSDEYRCGSEISSVVIKSDFHVANMGLQMPILI